MLYLLGILLIALPIVGLYGLSFFAKPPDQLGVEQGKLSPCPDSPNCVSSQASDSEHRIEPIAFQGTPTEAMVEMKRVLASMPRVTIVEESPTYLRAEAKSLIFRFTDDLELLLDANEKVFHVRSASRVGRSDLGANRKRVEQIRRMYDERD